MLEPALATKGRLSILIKAIKLLTRLIGLRSRSMEADARPSHVDRMPREDSPVKVSASSCTTAIVLSADVAESAIRSSAFSLPVFVFKTF